MKKFKIFSIALIAFGSLAYAQDLEQANKAIDAEQYEKAKNILKGLTISKSDEGKVFFTLGNLYLQQKVQDSAAAVYQKGLNAKKNPNLNYIGLGQIDLENGKQAEAKANFDRALEKTKKKDFEELLYIGRAYLNISKPDYKKALEYLNQAKAAQPMNAQVLLSLGDAYNGDKNVNDAYSAYRNSYDADNSVLRAKLQLGVLTKGSKAFEEAKKAFDNILATNPQYGPAYRELAETYYLWALNDKPKYAEYNKKAIEYYEKYMSLTDYSLESRMRHADFLILTKDYKALEAEANAMQKLDKVNPRILRYLGYSAYQNGNYDASIQALNKFLTTDKAKIIGRDHLYLGLAKTAKAVTTGAVDKEGKPTYTVNQTLFTEGIADLKKGVELDLSMANELNDHGKVFFERKLYREAASIYEIAILNPDSRNFLYDNFYLGYALYFHNANKPETGKINTDEIAKANAAFAKVIEVSPTTQDAYVYKARVNSLLENDPAAQAEMVKNYEEYMRVVTEKGEAELSKPATKAKFVEAYNNIGIFYAKTDKARAKESFEKALAIDPQNETAISTMKLLK